MSCSFCYLSKLYPPSSNSSALKSQINFASHVEWKISSQAPQMLLLNPPKVPDILEKKAILDILGAGNDMWRTANLADRNKAWGIQSQYSYVAISLQGGS